MSRSIYTIGIVLIFISNYNFSDEWTALNLTIDVSNVRYLGVKGLTELLRNH